jgi:hypothetical protein
LRPGLCQIPGSFSSSTSSLHGVSIITPLRGKKESRKACLWLMLWLHSALL